MFKENNLISRFVSYNKNLKFCEGYVIVKPEIVVTDNLDTDNKDLIIFINELKSNINNVDFSVLKRNLKNLIINYSDDSSNYDVFDNTLNLNLNNKLDNYVELLNLASSFFYNDIVYMGFNQIDPIGRIEVGSGINYGYTELLAEKLSNQNSNNYPIEKVFASLIEKIVGTNFMSNHYFNTDLRGLFNELSNYTSREETFEFIKNLDFINRLVYNKNINNKVFKEVEKAVNESTNYIVNIIYNKIIDNNIDINLNELVNYFKPININGYTYDFNISNIINSLEETSKKLVK